MSYNKRETEQDGGKGGEPLTAQEGNAANKAETWAVIWGKFAREVTCLRQQFGVVIMLICGLILGNIKLAGA
ncbi:hypothetical protein GWI33_008234 [Rhynchophorus ferrugineus]|uniref:Uncharacterized protein n=1 Tax=Rhynchophorus ferrugineus TaxID=354439 RepID=A0A834IIJ9_RHYFE|nr:hypothetical protein GWI33_008234 [Rhynchophorus ferrugineus]